MSSAWNHEIASAFWQHAGFGASPDDIDRSLREGSDASIERALNFEMTPTTGLDQLLASYTFDFTTFGNDYEQFARFQQWWLLRMIHSPRQLEEKLTLFWHMHFATSYDKVDAVPLLFAQNGIFRTLGYGRFGDLLLGASRDPAMLVWLDNDTNVKDHPNENFAREVMELFTMGIGHYSQLDVTEGARAFTGWTLNPDTYAFINDDASHDTGMKSFLGQIGPWRGEDIITFLAGRAETAQLISRKLAIFFTGRVPGTSLLRDMVTSWTATRGNIKSLVSLVFRSSEMARALSERTQVKTPAELLAGAVRALGVQTDARVLADYGDAAGQSLYRPPNVSGWKGGLTWINTGSYLVRMNFANDVASARDGGSDPFWDAGAFYAQATLNSVADVISYAASRLGMREPFGGLREGLLRYLSGVPTPFVWNRDAVDQWGRGVIHLLMSSPEYQLQ